MFAFSIANFLTLNMIKLLVVFLPHIFRMMETPVITDNNENSKSLISCVNCFMCCRCCGMCPRNYQAELNRLIHQMGKTILAWMEVCSSSIYCAKRNTKYTYSTQSTQKLWMSMVMRRKEFQSINKETWEFKLHLCRESKIQWQGQRGERERESLERKKERER